MWEEKGAGVGGVRGGPAAVGVVAALVDAGRKRARRKRKVDHGGNGGNEGNEGHG